VLNLLANGHEHQLPVNTTMPENQIIGLHRWQMPWEWTTILFLRTQLIVLGTTFFIFIFWMTKTTLEPSVNSINSFQTFPHGTDHLPSHLMCYEMVSIYNVVCWDILVLLLQATEAWSLGCFTQKNWNWTNLSPMPTNCLRNLPHETARGFRHNW